MEENHDQSFDFLNLRFLVVAFAVIATLSFVSGAVFGAELKITAAQEEQKPVTSPAMKPSRFVYAGS